MPYPTKYTRQYDFNSYQNSNPTRPLPGGKVNVDLDALKQSTSEIIDFLKNFTRSDGKLANNSVGVNQLDSSVRIGFSAPTTWEANVGYAVGDTVFYANKFYISKVEHTSTDGFDESKWNEIVDFGEQATDAATSALAAAASESAAAGSESAAAGSAATAVDSAETAGNSAVAASGSATTATTKAADAFNYKPARTQSVSRSNVSKLDEVWSFGDYSAPDDGTTNAQPAIQKAIDDLSTAGGGTLFIPKPANAYRITSALVLPPNVSLRGDHGFSSILADDCDAIYLTGVTGFGNITIRDLTIRHVNSTAKRYAIVQPGDLVSTNAILVGITLRNLVIDSADVPIALLTAQNVVIDNIYGQNVGAGIAINGRTYVVFVSNCKFTKTNAAGSSAFGTGFGFDAQAFTYTDLGDTRPEGIQISNSQFFGFDTGVRAVRAGTVFMKGLDIDAAVNGVDIGYVDGGCVLRDSVVIVRGNRATYAVVGRGRDAPRNGTVLIDGNTFIGTELTGNNVFGAVINDTGSNQNNVTVSDNTFIDFSGVDILANNPGNVKLLNNKTIQTGALESSSTISIVMGTRTTGVNVIEKNDCARGFGIVTSDDLTNGYLVKRDNTVAGDPN